MAFVTRPALDEWMGRGWGGGGGPEKKIAFI